MQTFDSTDVGYFCFWEKNGGGGAPTSCGGEGRPFTDAIPATATIDDTIADICGLQVTTCPALNDYRAVDCAPTGTPNHDLCGTEGLDDGYCRVAETIPTTQYRCSTPCLTVDDCELGVASCLAGTPKVCEL
jgi:hypothetical protein